jgi:ketosteroid isomerase-like protein
MALKMEPSAVLASKATNSPSAESLAKVEPQAITPTQAVQTQSQPTTVAVTSLVTAMQLGAPVVTASPTLALVTAPATITPAAVPAAIPASVIAVATQSKLENLKAPLDLQTLIIEKINAWKTAWAAKDLPNYTAHYADDFAGDYPNHAAWLAARQRIISNANIVSISISNIKIIQTSNTEARSAFTQTYQSNKVTESGTKNLYFQRTGDRWLIVAEVFTKNS